MSLAIINGSPRGTKSNSSIITTWFLNGYKKDHDVFYLYKVNQFNETLDSIRSYDEFMFVMPLYVDGMPAQVKSFFETMFPSRDSFKGKKVTYIIHSGFGEGVHNRALEKYLKRFSEIMQMQFKGVIVLPGSEGFRLMPSKMTQKKNDIVSKLGQLFMDDEVYPVELLSKLVAREKMSIMGKIFLPVLGKIGLTNIYWNNQLKSNGAYDKRFDAPYK